MEKNLYFELSDGADVSRIVMKLDACMEWIKADVEGVPDEDLSEFEFTIKPIMLTDDEYENLNEADI